MAFPPADNTMARLMAAEPALLKAAQAPPVIAGLLEDLERVHTRLAEAHQRLEALTVRLGGPREAIASASAFGEAKRAGSSVAPGSALHALETIGNHLHGRLGDIEDELYRLDALV